MLFIFRLGRDPKAVGKNTIPADIWGGIATVRTGGAAILLVVFAFLYL